jgi:hypothetical protein
LSFLNPLFLFGALAAAIPIIIHLFTRRRPREVRFPSLEFLSEVNQSEIRRLKLKQWLLLLLRVLAIAALALAMARPALRGNVGAQGRAATTIVALVDQSGSMSATGGAAPSSGSTAAGTLVAQARRVTEDLLATLGPQDELLLVPYDRTPHPITARPSSDLGRLRAAAQALAPSAHVTDHPRALEFAAAALRQSHALNRELIWISDFQGVGFLPPGAIDAAAPPAIGRFQPPDGPWSQTRVYLVPMNPRSRANVGLVDATLTPSESDVALSVSALSFGAPSGDLAVEVRDAQGERELGRGFLNVPERGESSTLLPLSALPAQGGVARLPEDALALDNTRVFAAGRAGTVTVLLREDGQPSAARLALEAGSPASGITVEIADGSSFPSRAAAADAIVLNDLERLGSAELQAVLDFHRGGGGLLVVLGSRADPGFWNPVLREIAAGELGESRTAAEGSAWRLVRVAAGHPVLAGFPARPGEPLSSARFNTIRELRPAPGTRTLLEFDRAHPALIEAQHALVFASSLEPDASDLPMSGVYLPLLHQLVKVLGRGTAATSLTPGQRYTAPAGIGAWRIEDDHGREIPLELEAGRGATRLVSAPLERPGLYRVLHDGTLRNTFAVNPDAREFDLQSVPERALIDGFPAGRAQVLRPGADLARRVREARYGRELWAWFVVIALLLLIAEGAIGRWGMQARAATPAARSA